MIAAWDKSCASDKTDRIAGLTGDPPRAVFRAGRPLAATAKAIRPTGAAFL